MASDSYPSLQPPGSDDQPRHWTTGKALADWQGWAKQFASAITHSWSEPQSLEYELNWLLETVAGLESLALKLGTYRDRKQIPLSLPLDEMTALWTQRLTTRQPIQYLLGFTVWREFVLQVSPAVLIPRPETELIIDLAVEAVRARGEAPAEHRGHWVDLGTGSGAIAIGLATVFPQAIIHAVDISPAALEVAQANATTYDLQERIQFFQGAWCAPLPQGQTYQGLISNPPYIPSPIVPQLQPEVAWHEPQLALDGGDTGLEAIRMILAQAPPYLQTGGVLILELMAGQSPTVEQLLQDQHHYQNVTIHTDWSGISRFAQALYSP